MKEFDHQRALDDKHQVHEPLGAEVLRGQHGTGRSVQLISFVAVMAGIEVLDVFLTFRLHGFNEDNNFIQRLADDVSRVGNVLFLLFLVASIIAVIVSREKTPRFVLPMLTTYLSVASLNVLINIMTMFIQPLSAHQNQVNPLIDLILVFSSVTLIFSLWYELIDVTSPVQAIEFPHRGREGEPPIRWFDYLVISFYSNSTFGPTTETIRSRRVQFLMMVQVSLALMVLVVLVARIVKAS
jgi:hypothetical protein